MIKKKRVEGTKAVAFKAIQPILLSPAPIITETVAPPPPQLMPQQEAKLVIETPTPRPQKPAVVEEQKEPYKPVEKKPVKNGGKLSSLDALRQKIAAENDQQAVVDKPLEMEALQGAWKKFIDYLKEQKRPAWQSYELAELKIKDEASFEVIVHNKINEKFIELERKEAGEFFQKQLCNRVLQFTITLIEPPKEQQEKVEAPMTPKDQYLKLIEEFPLVKELKDRLRLELDY